MAVLEKRKRIAPESIKTQRARRKLQKQWEQESRLITKEALDQTVNKIHKWIEANVKNRVVLKNTGMRLFNQNQDAAPLSKKVKQFAEKILDQSQLKETSLLR